MRGQFYALKLLEMAASSKYTDSHPLLKETRRQAADQEFLDGEENPPGVDWSRSGLRTSATGGWPGSPCWRRSRPSRPTHALAAAQKAEGGQRKRVAHRELETRDRNGQASYRKYAANLEQARIDQEMGAADLNIKLVQPATLEVKPVRPRVLWNLVLGLLVGGVGGVGLALTAEYGPFVPDAGGRLRINWNCPLWCPFPV